MNVTVIGTGFVGVVTSAVLASFKNQVIGLDIDPKKIEMLEKGKVPFFEPGLEELLVQTQETGNLHFTTSYEKAVSEADVIMVAVGTPSAPDGTADLRYVFAACESLAPFLKEDAVVCIKSTVPPGTLAEVEPKIKAKTKVHFVLASVPEFLREGSAVQDTLHPDRVVIGCLDTAAQAILRKLHTPFDAPILFVAPESAQMGKYAANAYLATRITFINQMADLCEKNGADVLEVINIIGEDKRIGRHYWYPGLGYGGSCFPKDVRELAAYSRTIGLGNNLFNKVHELNAERIFQKLNEFESEVKTWAGKKVAVLGLSFKPQTDDMREAPSTKIVPHLLQQGATVLAFDPMATEVAQTFFFEPNPNLHYVSLDKAVEEADVILATIEWPEITQYPFDQKEGRGRLFIDARDQFDAAALKAAGWKYRGIGRPSQ